MPGLCLAGSCARGDRDCLAYRDAFLRVLGYSLESSDNLLGHGSGHTITYGNALDSDNWYDLSQSTGEEYFIGGKKFVRRNVSLPNFIGHFLSQLHDALPSHAVENSGRRCGSAHNSLFDHEEIGAVGVGRHSPMI